MPRAHYFNQDLDSYHIKISIHYRKKRFGNSNFHNKPGSGHYIMASNERNEADKSVQLDSTVDASKLNDPDHEALKDTNFVKNVDGKAVLRYYPDRPEAFKHKEFYMGKGPSKFYDPCALSSKMAVRCMENHDEDYKTVCSEYFKAYRECKKVWLEKRRKGTW